MKRVIIAVVFLISVLLFNGATTFADSSNFPAQNQAAESLKNKVGDKFAAPYVIKDNEFISTNTGSLSISKIDYVLKGRNGNQFEIKRDYCNQNTDRPIFGMRKGDTGAIKRPAYLFSNGRTTIHISFLCEDQLNEVCPNGILSGWDPNGAVSANNTQYYLYEKGCASTNVWIKLNNSPEYPVYLDAEKYDNPGDGFHMYDIGDGWKLSLPYIRIDDCTWPQSVGTYYGEFFTEEGPSYQLCYSVTDYSITHRIDNAIYVQNENCETCNNYTGTIIASSCSSDVTYNGILCNRIITDKYGKVMYFNAKGAIAAMIDRFGNKVSFEYTNDRLSQISLIDGVEGKPEGSVHSVSLGTDGQGLINSITLLKNGQPDRQVVGYKVENTGGINYRLTVTDAESNSTKYDSEKRILGYAAGDAWMRGFDEYAESYNLLKVTYPTGASTVYTYKKDLTNYVNANDDRYDNLPYSESINREYLSSNYYGESSGDSYRSYGKREKYKIDTRYDVDGANIYNNCKYEYNYIYNNVHVGGSQYDKFIPPSASFEDMHDKTLLEDPEFDTRYAGKITKTISDVSKLTITDTYDKYGRKISSKSEGSDGYNVETTYGYLSGAKPVASDMIGSISEKKYNTSDSTKYFITTKSYAYDSKRNLTGKTENGLNTAYTYDPNYSILLTQTYNRDSAHQVVLNNVLYNNTSNSSDPRNGKCVQEEDLYENTYPDRTLSSDKQIADSQKSLLMSSIQKSKKTYQYDTYGNTKEVHTWSDLNDPKTEIVTYTDYIDNTDNTYNVKTRVVNVYDADNLNPVTVETETDYDYYGNPVKVVDAKQNPVIYQYDSMNREKSEKYVDGNSKSFEYFVKDNYIIIHDERDNLVKKQFDGLGREKASYVFNPQKALWLQVSAIEYDEWGRKKTETFFRNYDDSANVTEKFVFTYEYLTDGSLKHVYETDKNGSTQKDSNYKYEYGVTVSGLPGTFGKITETVKKKSTESYSPYIKYVNEYGQVRREETSHSQDGVNKIYSKTYGYDFVGNKLWEKNPRIDDEKLSNAYTTQYEYDYANHVTKETNAKLDFAVTKYDDLGRVKAKDDFNKYETTYTYDKLGRLVRTETPFVKDSNNNIITSLTKNYYDKNGNITTVLVQNNTPGDSTSTFNKTDYVYDSRNRLTEVIKYNTDNTKNITQYKYDAAGNKTYMYTGLSAEVETNTDTDFAVTSYLYNYLNQMVSMTDPQQRTITYKYDLAGNVIKANDRMGIETTYAYNSFGELIDKKATKDGTSKEVTFEYDLTGKRIIMVDESGTTNFEYDDIGRLITETAGSIVKSYGYDADGNRKTFTLIKSGSSVLSQSYDYDLTNRLWHVFENTNSIAEYKYDANGNRTTLKYPAIGVTANYNYNFANKLTNLDYGNGVSYTYTYYLDGNQKSKQGPEGSTIYTYDGVGRLAQVTSGTDSTLYQYDDYNNRSKMTVTGSANYTVGYNYDKNNCLLTEDKAQNGVEQITQYGYDDNGNQIYKGVETLQAGTGNQESVAGYTPGDSGSGSDVTIYDFDLFNQLLKVTQGATVVGYKYNGDGLRASKTIGTDTVSHVWDGDQIVVELKNGTVSGRFIRGINLIYSDMGGNVRYYFYNGHGDVTRLADGTGKIVKSYDYDEFGNEKGIEPGDVNPFRYCGEYFDKETGTIYLRARYYNPANGRFVSEDSVRGKDNDPLSLNLYTYCGNDPIDMFDPSGHQTVSSYAPEEYSDRVLYNERTAENPYIPSNVRDQITGGTQSNSGDGPNAIFNPKKDVYILGTENGDTAFAAKLGDDKASVYVGKVQGEVTKPCLNNDGFSVGIAGKAAGLQVNASNKYGDEKGNVNADIKVAATGGYGEVGLNFSANTKNPGFKAGGSVAAGRVDGETNMNIFFFHLKIAPHAAVLSAEANAKAGVDMEHMKVSGGFGLGLGLSAGVDFEVGPRENGK